MLALTLLVNSLFFYLTLDNNKGKKDEEVRKILQDNVIENIKGNEVSHEIGKHICKIKSV